MTVKSLVANRAVEEEVGRPYVARYSHCDVNREDQVVRTHIGIDIMYNNAASHQRAEGPRLRQPRGARSTSSGAASSTPGALYRCLYRRLFCPSSMPSPNTLALRLNELRKFQIRVNGIWSGGAITHSLLPASRDLLTNPLLDPKQNHHARQHRLGHSVSG